MAISMIKIIYDNCKTSEEFQEGWGFSALVETSDHKILFDTGNDRDAFFSNAAKMGIDLGQVTGMVFSHKHADHVAGCYEILAKLPQGCPVYLPRGFPHKKIPPTMQVQVNSDLLEVGKNLFVLTLRGGLFLYEQVLVLKVPQGLVVVTGCAHPGITKILEVVEARLGGPLYLVLGGFHLFRKQESFAQKVVDQFQRLQVKKVAPCHCSGKHTIASFEKAYKGDFEKVGAGTVLTLA